ncbi:uncharacterized protein BXZ73DRAFT_59483 [Epithele typhae]|uniref:uncharacterized protein n=1 Tax=Epithele typhae TaxID=378194 RepID=UPI002008B043|nr:uncharacterized protein BXZ73DRAFT_59483 [Epithele typhae]KAH9909444.1 hypothetical protein BXZ73DRAFT_59483 [Epithele typhae]
MPGLYTCHFCGRKFRTEQGTVSHTSQSSACKKKRNEQANGHRTHTEHLHSNAPQHDPSIEDGIPGEEFLHDTGRSTIPDPPLQQPNPHRVTVEEVEDEDAGGIPKRLWRGEYPRSSRAGERIRKAHTMFDTLLQQRRAEKIPPESPFSSEEEWELVKWLFATGMSQEDMDKFLHLRLVEKKTQLSFKNKYELLKKMEQLPRSAAEWICNEWEVIGDVPDEMGQMKTEDIELWRRDPVECIRELIGNPVFCEFLKYAPERLLTRMENGEIVIDEMWTADWWWEMQGNLPPGATIAPVILASDKTQLSRFSGDKQAWPSTRSLEIWRVFHHCMAKILEPLKAAARDGVEMVCADGFVRRVHPLIAAYIADHPEQCLVSCCQENFCPKCSVHAKSLGVPDYAIMKDQESVWDIINDKAHGRKTPEFKALGLRLVDPFWRGHPHCDICSCITPDILHQLHKGVFKDHTVSWATDALDGKEDELDRRFKVMPSHPGLRHFKKGISLVSQWTGTEFKHMERVFLGAIAGTASNPAVQRALRAVLDFIYYAHFEAHTNRSLALLDAAWRSFHQHKQVFITLGIREHFNIPKLHAMLHYALSIRRLGSADGFNTEATERLHIDTTKDGYNASNRRDYIKQMAAWLNRQELIARFQRFLDWADSTTTTRTSSGEGGTQEEEEAFSEEEEEDGDVAMRDATDARTEQFKLNSEPPHYLIAKRPPFSRTTVRDLVNSYGCIDFARNLEQFLTSSFLSHPLVVPAATINAQTFPVYHRATVYLAPLRQVSSTYVADTIRARPKQQARPLRRAVPGHFDTVLAWEPGVDIPPGPSLVSPGLRVARVRAIFRLPAIYGGRFKHPLAYVEWYTPFHEPDPTTGMFQVSVSSHNHHRRSSIIPITSIARSCHLIPVFGKAVNRAWTTDNVLDLCKRFFVNPYLRHHDFVLFRYLNHVS